MSQLVFQSTLGGSITFIGADTGSAYTVAVPAQSGTLLFQDGSNNFTVQNLIVNGTGTFYGATTFASAVSLAVPATFAGFTCSADGVFTGTGEIQIPAGTTAQRSATPATGMIRYNTSYGQYEGYNGSAWGILGGGATGSGGDRIFVLNGQTVNNSYTLPTGSNASTAGPVTLATGAVVTVPTGSRWVIV